jgi:site-specific recombinase XerD
VTERRIAKLGTFQAHVLPPLPDLRAIRAAEDTTNPQRPTIGSIIAQYLEWKSGAAAVNTIRTYRDGLRHFAQFLAMSGIDAFSEEADVLPVSILEQHIVRLRQRPSVRSGRPLAKTAVATSHAAVLDCFKWATRRKLVSDHFR